MSVVGAGGKIITFYSYKGGTGRSMALANVAWALAANRKRVLVIDWDLEAPGLHRYFRPFLIDKYLASSDGLIDCVMEFADEAIQPPSADANATADDWYVSYADVTRYALSINFADFPSPGKIDFIPAGRQSTSYATRVSTFNWQNFYDRLGGGAFLEALKAHVRRSYDYILVDSRTGVSDTAGICTVQMPDALAVCFTYNNQSIEGAAAVAASAREERRKLHERRQSKDPADTGAFDLFPIPTRVEQAELDKLNARRRYAQSLFDELLAPSLERASYWREVEIPYVQYHGYEEVLAPFTDDANDPKSILYAIVRITHHLTDGGVSAFQLPLSPEAKQQVLLSFAETPVTQASTRSGTTLGSETASEKRVRLAESSFVHLPADRQVHARSLWTRLVRVARPDEGGEPTRQRIPMKELGQGAELVQQLAQVRLLAVDREVLSGIEMVEIADDALLRLWPRLRGWIQGDLEFLLWRQKLRELIPDWERSDYKSDFLLRGEPLRTAEQWLATRSADLNDAEVSFVRSASRMKIETSPRPSTAGLKVCILRPFGTRSEIDFERVERTLIAPALESVNTAERTTVDIGGVGKIRVGMLQRLLTANLVVADVSIHDANVFYELGVRHALRNRRTLLLRSDGHSFPFDLQTDRYFVYDGQNPAASLHALIQALQQTLASTDLDSPIFRSLPDLQQQERSVFLVVPASFREDVERAAAKRHLGDLELLAEESHGLTWETAGLRLVGRAQFKQKALRGARRTWEALRAINADDLEANRRLGTIYERLGDLVASEQASRRALEAPHAAAADRAEALSLLARNAKTRWRNEWEPLPPERQREEALRSRFLEESLEAYAHAFKEDLNQFYSGLNALALLQVQSELAAALPEVWAAGFDDPDADAAVRLAQAKRRQEELAGAVAVAIDAARARLERERRADVWVSFSEADLALLTADRPARVANAYRRAISGADPFAVEAALKQVQLYEKLGVRSANVAAALREFGSADTVPPAPTAPQGRVLLFTGHMVDAPGRAKPRFPPTAEASARRAISAAVQEERRFGPIELGMAGGSSGGDILFHEVCDELGVDTQLFLALPPERYVAELVGPAGPAWVARFNRLYAKTESRVLSSSSQLPDWLAEREPDYGLSARYALWLLHNALAERSDRVTLIALWNGAAGDGPGSTAEVVGHARERGAKVVILDTNGLFALGES